MDPNSEQVNQTDLPADSRVARVPEQVYPYSAGIVGGVLGGLAMIPVAMIYGLMSGHGIWYPVNMIAATLIRSWQGASAGQMEQFSATGLLVGLIIHLVISVLLGLTFAILLPTLPRSPLFWAFVVGPILWAGATFAGLPLLNPMMAHFIDWPSFIIANVAYSLVVGLWVARTPKILAQ